MKVRQTARSVIGVMAVLSFLTIIHSATFLLTSSIYQRIGQQPSPFLAYIITSILGLFFSFLILTGLSLFFKSKMGAHRMRVFRPIIEAIHKIAKGDFSVRVDNIFQEHEFWGELARNVNTMALELNQMEQLRQEFISNVSHEIQSPLTSIRGFAQALQNDQLSPEERHHYLDIIEAESKRLSRITDNLLRLASLESDQAKFEPRAYRLDKQIRNLILACEPQWTGKQIDMDVSLAEAVITADEDLLGQVWLNLIHNSIKFTSNGGRVGVELHRWDNQLEFKIVDTGIGISVEDQARVFERFYKVDKSRTGSNGGSGLGLSIAQKIVEMHRGIIGVDSELGVGTTFIVSLPVEP
jgi:two-component system, OmpR family, phosphate regulon sensor histidine kinase PhoR